MGGGGQRPSVSFYEGKSVGIISEERDLYSRDEKKAPQIFEGREGIWGCFPRTKPSGRERLFKGKGLALHVFKSQEIDKGPGQ